MYADGMIFASVNGVTIFIVYARFDPLFSRKQTSNR